MTLKEENTPWGKQLTLETPQGETKKTDLAETPDITGRTCGDCGNGIRCRYPSGKSYYKCSLRKPGQKGRAIKKGQAACQGFKDGPRIVVFCETSYEL